MTYFQLLESLHTEYRRRHAAPMTRPVPSSALFLALEETAPFETAPRETAPLETTEGDDRLAAPTTRAANDNSPVSPGLRRFIG